MHTECHVTYQLTLNNPEFKLITQALNGTLPTDEARVEAKELSLKLLQQRVAFLKDQADKAEKSLANIQDKSS